jgi:hypothetical protein
MEIDRERATVELRAREWAGLDYALKHGEHGV